MLFSLIQGFIASTYYNDMSATMASICNYLKDLIQALEMHKQDTERFDG